MRTRNKIERLIDLSLGHGHAFGSGRSSGTSRVLNIGQALCLLLIVVAVSLSSCARAQDATQTENPTLAAAYTPNPAYATAAAYAQTIDYTPYEGKLNFYLANDLGRNGYYDQKPLAELMGEMATEVDPKFILAAGDVHHFNGVESTADPLWMTNYELIYSHPELMIDWFPILGNHEYRGNTQAVIGYSKVSRRWEMPARYYTKSFEKKGASVRVVWIDTSPIIDKYREDTEVYPDAVKQDYQAQLAWLDKVLSEATEDWVIVAGHHPIYADTSKDDSERLDLQHRLDPILRKHNVALYVNGHIHNFQHIHLADSPVEYVTNSAASLSRGVEPVEGTVFCSPEPGFSIISVSKDTLQLRMIDKRGQVLHLVEKTK